MNAANQNKTRTTSTRLLAVAVLAGLASSPAALAGWLVDVDVLDRHNGRLLPEFAHRGQSYIPGQAGAEFSVVLTNRSNERVMAVLSVDGINAISGQTADTNQAGYVLEPYASVTIDGWRKSMHDTAAFYFTELPDSYAARTGRPQNVGVIGVAVFRERDYPTIPRWSEGRRYGYDDRAMPAPAEEYARRDNEGYNRTPPTASAPPAGVGSGAGRSASEAAPSYDGGLAKRAPQPTDSLGTGHGRREYNPVQYTDFRKRSNRPDEVTQVWYDSWPNLAAAGIIPRHLAWDYRPQQPQAFPNQGFVPDPRW